jgi:hypothetical protein
MNPSPDSKEILARSLTRHELFDCEYTGYFLGGFQLLTPVEIQEEIERRERHSSSWSIPFTPFM